MENNNSPYNNIFQDAPMPYWIASTKKTSYPILYEDIKTDVAIIGGGIAGITAAYLLKKEGLKVVIVEADHIVQGTTAHTTAKITSQHGLIYNELINKFGKEKARQYAEANQVAIRFIENTIKEKDILCDFSKQSAYVFTEKEAFEKKIEEEINAATDIGLPAAYLGSIPLPFSIKAAICFDNQAQFHPRKYLLSLASEIPLDGSYIFEQTRVVDIEQGNSCTLLTNTNKKIIADKVIIASHFPFYDGLGLYFTRMYTDRSYIIGAKVKEKFPGGMYINAENPTISLRSQEVDNSEMLLVVGEDHKTGYSKNTDTHYENLIKYAKEIFQMEKLLYRWSAQDCKTLDNVPYIGNLTSDTPNIFVATGFGKWGITNGTAAAMIIKDLIIKGSNPYEDVFSPSRFTPIASAKNFVVQNSGVAEKFIGGKLSPAESNIDVSMGEAKIIEVNNKKSGAYRDYNNVLHIVNITCTHLGCTLVWNSAEKSWDCPCHGSRFTYDGEIIEGPAHNPLENSNDKKNVIDPNI